MTFESIGRTMLKGAGVSLNDTAAPKYKARKRSDRKQARTNNNGHSVKKTKDLASAIEVGSMRESKLAALHLILEFGTKQDKSKVIRELHLTAYGRVQLPEQPEQEQWDLHVLESSSDGSTEDPSSCDDE